MREEERAEVLAELGVEGDGPVSPERRFERRIRSAMVDARCEGTEYWQTFELLERYQRAAVRASFEAGEFGDAHVGVDPSTVQYSQVVHATARAVADGASKRQLLVNLASAYGLFEEEWRESDEESAARDESGARVEQDGSGEPDGGEASGKPDGSGTRDELGDAREGMEFGKRMEDGLEDEWSERTSGEERETENAVASHVARKE